MANYSIVDIGRELQKYGLRIGENPAFGSVGGHAPDSYHYKGQAIDVTDWRPDVAPAFAGGQPLPWKQRTGQLSWRAKPSGLFTEALGPGDKDHETHVHLAADKPVSTTPEMLQWIATGRYKTPEGKLTDVMPGAQQLGASDTGGQQQTTPGNVYNIFLGGSRRRKQSNDPLAFLLDYINPLRTSTTQPTAMFNPYEVLSSTLNAQPQFYG